MTFLTVRSAQHSFPTVSVGNFILFEWDCSQTSAIHLTLGHSLGLDVHDVPSASNPEPESENKTIPELSHKHPLFYTYLRLRLPLEAGMVIVSVTVNCCHQILIVIC